MNEDVRLVKVGDKKYDVYVDDRRVTYVGYSEGDREWRYRVTRGRTASRNNGWYWASFHLNGAYKTNGTLRFDTRKEAVADLLRLLSHSE